MTNEERFEKWWGRRVALVHSNLLARSQDFPGFIDVAGDLGYFISHKGEAHAAWNAAALPDDVREACIEALREKEAMDIYGWGADGDSAKESERYAAARKWLEEE